MSGMNFVKKGAIPKKKAGGGRSGTNWLELFEKIPNGQAWRISEDEYKPSTVKSGLARVNEDLGEERFEAVQRTEDDGKSYLYVSRKEA